MRYVQIKVLIILPIFYVFWLLALDGSVSCQKVRQNTRVLATRTEPGAAVQALMSKMMSLMPANATADLFGGRGISGPNLAYEPYWTNVPDMEWEEKCKRCSTLFEKYKLVCAVDSTGDVYVNTSLCGMLWQNCLGGNAKGSISYDNKVRYKDFYIVAQGWARFSVRAQEMAFIMLSNKASQTPPYYELILDNRLNGLYTNGEHNPLVSFQNKWVRLITPSEFTEYVVRWNATSGWILITKSSYTNWTEGFYINYTHPWPFNIKYISFGTISTANKDARYIVNDIPTGFTVESLGPCADISEGVGIAHTLATNPTAIPVINKMYSAYNLGYFTRLATAGLDPEKKAFSTREEY